MQRRFIHGLFKVLLFFHIITISFPAQAISLFSTTQDIASLQRGAKWYMNACASCHSLRYIRYEQLSQDLHIPPALVQQTLNFTNSPLSDTIQTALSPQEGTQWFGAPPPDLTLIIQAKGADFVYAYLNEFYDDPRRPWGTNNLASPDTAMPNVLLNWRGTRIPVYQHGKIVGLKTIKSGTMTPTEFDQMTRDIVNFLTYTSTPAAESRGILGAVILCGLLILALGIWMLWRT